MWQRKYFESERGLSSHIISTSLCMCNILLPVWTKSPRMSNIKVHHYLSLELLYYCAKYVVGSCVLGYRMLLHYFLYFVLRAYLSKSDVWGDFHVYFLCPLKWSEIKIVFKEQCGWLVTRFEQPRGVINRSYNYRLIAILLYFGR
jgi:hypothetical protein